MRLALVLFLSFNLLTASYLDYPHPYHPTESEKGMVVSQNYLSSDIGADILSQGGNAIDAAVAVGFSLTATLPRAGNIGGGGFMLIYDAKNDVTVALDFRSMAPALASPETYLDKTLNTHDYNQTRRSYKAIAVPGTVAGLIKAHETYGSLPLAQLIQPTINLLKSGVPITQDLYWAMQDTEFLKLDEESKNIYINDKAVIGGKIFNDDLIRTLELIQENGRDGFYTGETAEKIEQAMIANGGLIRKSDLEQYKVDFTEPISTTYRDNKIFTMGAPSGGGVAILTSLNVLENFDLTKFQPNSAKYTHLLAEVMKYGQQSRSKYIGDPRFNEIPMEKLLSKEYAKLKSKNIKLKRATNVDKLTTRTHDLDKKYVESKDTTHYSIIDEEGNAVSVTYTLGYSFGSGVTIEGTGILGNNQMNNFAHEYGRNNSLRRSSSPANKLEPLKRPMSTMAPLIIFDKNNEIKLITGSPGGSQIPNINLQVVLNVLDFNLDIGEATMTPRIHQDSQNNNLLIEKTINTDTRRILTLYGHTIEISDTIGSTQSIHVINGKNYGYADLRRPNAKVSIQK